MPIEERQNSGILISVLNIFQDKSLKVDWLI